MKKIDIDVLINNDFEHDNLYDNDTLQVLKHAYGIDEFDGYRIDTQYIDGCDNNIIITIQRGCTNNNAEYHVHVDNNRYCTIGSADISYIEQFNMLMEIFGSKFRLK